MDLPDLTTVETNYNPKLEKNFQMEGPEEPLEGHRTRAQVREKLHISQGLM